LSPRKAVPGEAVAALAREVGRLRDAWDTTDPAGLREDVHGLAVTVAGLAEQVAELAESGAGREAPAPSWLWPSILAATADDPDGDRTAGARAAAADAARLLAQVIDWAGRVYVRFTDGGRLPECWLWHPDVVEELVWLWRAWTAAYRGKAASVARAADWHDRHRPGVTRRVTAAAGSCSLREHLDPPPTPAVPTVDAAAVIAASRAEPDQPAPAPTGAQIAAAEAALTRRAGGRR
jgi:hypothetical protein